MKKTRFVLLFLIVLSLWNCNDVPEGYTKITTDVYKKMLAFDEHGPKLGNSEFSAIYVFLRNSVDSTVYNDFMMYCGEWKNMSDSLPNADTLFLNELEKMERGQRVSFLLPHKMVKNTFIDGFVADSLPPDTEVELVFGVLETFERNEFLSFLTHEAQKGGISEAEAIDFSFLNKPDSVEVFGEVFFQWHTRSQGNTPLAGEDVTIKFGTDLLDGTILDTLSEMSFTYGKPGQIVPGLSYALSKMKRGEKADVYMPSYMAFGEYGSSTGLVPAFTPVKFRVELMRNDSVSP